MSGNMWDLARLPSNDRHAVDRRIVGESPQSNDYVLAGKSDRTHHVIPRTTILFKIFDLICGPDLVKHAMEPDRPRSKLLGYRAHVHAYVGIEQGSLVSWRLDAHMPPDDGSFTRYGLRGLKR
jgi:hypothetical protein